MDRILSVGVFQQAQQAFNDALKAAGYAVWPCAGPAHAKWLFRKHHHEVVLLGATLPSRVRSGLAACVRQTSPQTPIVGLYNGAIEGANVVDAIINAGADPSTVVEIVRRLRAQQGVEMRPMRPQVLCICATENAAILRKQALVDEGYEVVRAVSLKDIESACARKVFDLAVLGPAIGPWMKGAIADVLRAHLPKISILELGRTEPQIPGADCVASEAACEWLAAVRLLVNRLPSRVRRPGQA